MRSALQTILNLGGQMFPLPGGGGGVDASYAALMSPYLGTEALAFTLLVWRTYTFYWYVITGGPVFLIMTGKAVQTRLGRRRTSRYRRKAIT